MEAWLSALTSPDRAAGPGIPEDLAVLAADGASLAEALRAWHATADTAAEAVRTCFRIQPPIVGDENDGGDDDTGEDRANRSGDEEDVDADAGPPRSQKRGRRPPQPAGADDWRIEFALQAVDDPSLFVRAPAVWADGPELTALERHVAHPDELLLRGLGLAARLVPSLGSALATAMPSEQVTDAAGVLSVPPRGSADPRRGGLRGPGAALVALGPDPAGPSPQGQDAVRRPGRRPRPSGSTACATSGGRSLLGDDDWISPSCARWRA